MKKRKILGIISLLMIVAMPVFAMAAAFKTSKDNLNVPSSETVENDLYAGGGNVQVDGTIKGDLIVAGGQVNISGEVTESVLVIGGQVNIKGKVGDDIRVLGGNVTVGGEVAGDLIALGGMVETLKDSKIKGDVDIASGQAKIGGEAGTLSAAVGTLTISGSAKINGNVTYYSQEDAIVENGAKISGGITHKQPEKADAKTQMASKFGAILMTLTSALFVFWFFPKKSQKVSEQFVGSFWKNILWGLGFIVVVPVALVLILATVLGMPLAFTGGAVYGILLYLGKVFAVLGLAFYLKSLIFKGENPSKDWISIIIAVLVYYILKFIPFVGWLAIAIIYLSALGALVMFDKNLLFELKKEERI